MSFGETLFSYKGRIGRLAYLGYSLMSNLVWTVLICLGTAMAQSDKGLVPGGLIVLAGFVGAVWVSFALMIKRLHDLGGTGLHSIWIMLLYLAADETKPLSKAAAEVLGVACFGVGCCLLFNRGNDCPNKYGPPPGTSRARNLPAT